MPEDSVTTRVLVFLGKHQDVLLLALVGLAGLAIIAGTGR